ncbi:MAG: PP2C family protein-serine/threonine phosphatase, partial [Cyanobacteria bacterium REEB65]|nr:PP2C family protein-serine/threonine phosphatase [Cyanobacteria bacterium REEB65]
THYFSWVNILSLAFIGPTAGQLALRMPRTPRWLRDRPALAYLPLWPGAILALLTLLGYTQPTVWKPIYLADTLLVGLGLLAIPVAAAIAIRNRGSSASERAQGVIVLAGAIGGIVPTLVVTMAAFADVAIPGSELAYFLALLFPLSLAYAIVRWRLFDVEIVVKRTLVYALVTAALAALYFLATAALPALWGQQNARWANMLATAAVAVAFAPLRDRTKTLVDRLFFRNDYDFGNVLSGFADSARRTLDPQQLLEAFAMTLDQALHPQSIALYMRESGNLQLRYGDPPSSEALRLPIAMKEDEGLAVMGPRRSDQPYDAKDRELAAALTGQLALWLENAALFAKVARQERIQRELEIAREVQTGFLPQSLPQVPELAIAACTQPALEVGGDFYDVIDIGGDRLAILVGDVSGKGVPAALLMAMTVMVFRSLAPGNHSPAAVLRQANELIWLNRPSRKMFVTAFYGVLDRRTGEFAFANAGQPFPLTPTGPLPARGMALGIVPKSEYLEHSRSLGVGDSVLVYSDGVEDAINISHEHFGSDRLAAAAERCWDLQPEQLHDVLLRDIRTFSEGAEPFDDLTLLTIRRG